MAEGDDDFTLIRKSFRDVNGSLHRRAAQLARQNSGLAFVLDALMDYTVALHDAAVFLGREDEL